MSGEEVQLVQPLAAGGDDWKMKVQQDFVGGGGPAGEGEALQDSEEGGDQMMVPPESGTQGVGPPTFVEGGNQGVEVLHTFVGVDQTVHRNKASG